MTKKFKSFDALQKEIFPRDHARNLIKKSRKEEAARKKKEQAKKDLELVPPSRNANLLRTWAIMGALMAQKKKDKFKQLADQLDNHFKKNKMFTRVAKVTDQGIVFNTNKKELDISNRLLTRFGKTLGIEFISSKIIDSPDEVH